MHGACLYYFVNLGILKTKVVVFNINYSTDKGKWGRCKLLFTYDSRQIFVVDDFKYLGIICFMLL